MSRPTEVDNRINDAVALLAGMETDFKILELRIRQAIRHYGETENLKEALYEIGDVNIRRRKAIHKLTSK